MRLAFLPGESIDDYDKRRAALSRAEHLEKAAALLEEYGWNQGEYRNKCTGAICAEGAVTLAYTGTATTPGAGGTACLDAVAGLTVWLGTINIPWWNDQDGRTAEEVVATLRGYAADLRRQAGP